MRQEPLLPTDLTLVKEALTIVKTFPVYMLALIVVGFIAAIVILVFSFIRSEKQRPPVPCLRGAGSAGTEQSGL